MGHFALGVCLSLVAGMWLRSMRSSPPAEEPVTSEEVQDAGAEVSPLVAGAPATPAVVAVAEAPAVQTSPARSDRARLWGTASQPVVSGYSGDGSLLQATVHQRPRLSPIEILFPSSPEMKALMSDSRRQLWLEQYQRVLDRHHERQSEAFGSELPRVLVGENNRDAPRVETFPQPPRERR